LCLICIRNSIVVGVEVKVVEYTVVVGISRFQCVGDAVTISICIQIVRDAVTIAIDIVFYAIRNTIII